MAEEGDAAVFVDPSSSLSKGLESLDVGSSDGGKPFPLLEASFPSHCHSDAGSTHSSPARCRNGSLVNSADKAAPVFKRMTADTNGLLPVVQLPDFLVELDLSTDYNSLLDTIASPWATEISLDQA